MPEILSFAARETFKTPLKVKRTVEEGNAAYEVENRWKTCTGFPVQVYHSDGKDGRSWCAICKKKTKWYCIGCRAFFCVQSVYSSQDEPDKKFYYLPTYTENGLWKNDRIFYKSCFHEKHATAYEDVKRKQCTIVIDESE